MLQSKIATSNSRSYKNLRTGGKGLSAALMGIYYLIRHGETMGNRDETHVGQLDVPMTELGLKQADLTGYALKDVKFDAVYSSDLIRARQTADAILRYQEKDCPLVIDQRLREINGGIFHGLPLTVMRDWSLKQDDPFTAVRPYGESNEMLYERTIMAFKDILTKHPNSTIAISAHLIVIRYIVQYVMGIDPRERMDEIQNCSISVIEGTIDNLRVVKVSDTKHLELAD
jgi:broad specificity phosphatase PhoE